MDYPVAGNLMMIPLLYDSRNQVMSSPARRGAGTPVSARSEESQTAAAAAPLEEGQHAPPQPESNEVTPPVSPAFRPTVAPALLQTPEFLGGQLDDVLQLFAEAGEAPPRGSRTPATYNSLPVDNGWPQDGGLVVDGGWSPPAPWAMYSQGNSGMRRFYSMGKLNRRSIMP